MSIKASRYYPKQMNGSVISATGEAFNTQLKNAQFIENYLYNLSINSADETELENIGRIVGYIRPLVPEGFNEENVLILGPLPIETSDTSGLAKAGQNIGGQLSPVNQIHTGFMALGIYRKFLKSIAVLKRYGLTIQSIDKIVSQISTNYTIEWDEQKDIEIKFTDKIGYKNLWVLTQLFYKTATVPQVLITSAY